MDAGITNEAILTLEVVTEPVPRTVSSKRKAAETDERCSDDCDEDWGSANGADEQSADVTEEDKQV